MAVDDPEVISRVSLRIRLMAEVIEEKPASAARELTFMCGYIAGLMVEGLLSRAMANQLTAEAQEAKEQALC